jgi:hypothetical protein
LRTNESKFASVKVRVFPSAIDNLYLPRKLRRTIPKATREAINAATAKAVPPLSLSTTVLATATPPALGAVDAMPAGADTGFGAPLVGVETTPPGPATGVIGFAT